MNYSYLKSSCATSFSAQRKSSVGILQCLKSEIELMNDSNHDVTLPEIDARWVERFARDRNVLIRALFRGKNTHLSRFYREFCC